MHSPLNTKELIRNSLLRNASLFWGKKNPDKFDPLVRLMIEDLSNELYLIQNKVNEIDTLLLQKIATRLTPDFYTLIRPAHAIIQITPNEATSDIDRKQAFYLKEIPAILQSRGIDTIMFHPVINAQLMDVKITHIFHKNKLSEINAVGEKSVKAYSTKSAKGDSVWIGLDINKKIQNIKGLFFYFSFPGLDENHDYYEMLPYTEWYAGNNAIKFKKGLPLSALPSSGFENSIVRFYEDHFLTISEPCSVNSLNAEQFPSELEGFIDRDNISDLTPKYWIRVQYPSVFSEDDLDRMVIALNAFPVSNKRIYSIRLKKSSLTGMPLLPANKGEKYLNIENVTDSNNTEYKAKVSGDEQIAGTFEVETVKEKTFEEPGILDYIERLIDIIQDERVAFPSIDADKINEIMKSITELQGGNSKKIDINKKNNREEIAKILIHPYENTNTVDVRYWVTNGEVINNIPAGNVLMPQKTSKLNGQNASLLTEVCGGKEFRGFSDVMHIHKYILASRDRVVTKDNIIDFCKSELGHYVGDIQVEQGTRIGFKPKDGLIRQINVALTPSANYPHYLKQKGVLRDLRIRLKYRSPDTYNYNLYIPDVNDL